MNRRAALVAGVAGVAAAVPARAGASTGGDPVEVTTAMAVRFDLRQWAALRQVFADEVWLDYSALNGIPAGPVPADELVDGWRTGLGHLDATQHLLGNQLARVRGDSAEVTAEFQAVHRLGSRLWTLGGRYRYRLVRGWRISAVTMTPVWETGDRTIIGLPPA